MTLSMPLIDGMLSLGMTSIFSVGTLQKLRPFFVDEQAQFFNNELQYELYGDRLEVTTFIVGLAYQPMQHLSVGIGDDAQQLRVFQTSTSPMRPTRKMHFSAPLWMLNPSLLRILVWFIDRQAMNNLNSAPVCIWPAKAK